MQDPGQSIRLRSSARTSVGQVRENNEDNVRLWAHETFVLAVVADGMGGAAAGEEASRIAVEAIREGLIAPEYGTKSENSLNQMTEEAITDHLREAIRTANRSIMQKATTSPEWKGMGTTITLAFVRGTKAVVAHVGDSRAYLVEGQDGDIRQITADHSFVEALLAAGHITQEQAEEHPMRNVLYRALGQADDLDIDVYKSELHVGDRLILCSDGLTRHVKAPEIAQIARVDSNPDIASQKLIDLANERGGEDNVSVIVISVEQNTPSNELKREAVLMLQEDDEQTLLLKDRVMQSSPTISSEPPPPEEKDGGKGSGKSLNEQKMSAERVTDRLQPSDQVVKAEVEQPAPPSRVPASRPMPAIDAVPTVRYDPGSPATGSYDSEGEGHDTLTPDE